MSLLYSSPYCNHQGIHFTIVKSKQLRLRTIKTADEVGRPTGPFPQAEREAIALRSPVARPPPRRRVVGFLPRGPEPHQAFPVQRRPRPEGKENLKDGGGAAWFLPRATRVSCSGILIGTLGTAGRCRTTDSMLNSFVRMFCAGLRGPLRRWVGNYLP